MTNGQEKTQSATNRRSFMKKGLGVAAIGAGVLSAGRPMFGQSSKLSSGDTAILQFLAAAELIESDLWIQYAELGGIGDHLPIEVNPNQKLNPYLVARGAAPVDFTQFEILPGSTANGSSGKLRLTNLMQLNVDTSWYVRYRSATNPDLGAIFPQAITLSGVTAIPRSDADYNGTPNPNFRGNDHIQAIANVAGFHFGYIEQGGSSLYATMSQKVHDPEALSVTLGIGGDEIAHFLEWVDFSGNGVQAPVAPFTDSIS